MDNTVVIHPSLSIYIICSMYLFLLMSEIDKLIRHYCVYIAISNFAIIMHILVMLFVFVKEVSVMGWREAKFEEKDYIMKKIVRKDIFSAVLVGIFDIGVLIFTILNIRSDINTPVYGWTLKSGVLCVAFYIFMALILFFTMKGLISSIRKSYCICSGRFTVVDCILEEVEHCFYGRKNITNITAKTDSDERYSMSIGSYFAPLVHQGEKALLVDFGSRKEKDWKLLVPEK